MDSNEVETLFKFQESSTETSFDCALVTGTSTRLDNPKVIESCPSVLEPSKDKIHYEDESTRNPLNVFSDFPLQTSSFIPALLGSARIDQFCLEGGQLTGEEHQKRNSCSIICSAITNCYSNCAISFRNSRIFYFVQFLIGLLPLSAIAMGIYFSRYCTSTFPVLTFIIGIMGAMFVGVWTSINIFHHLGRRCTGQQKFLVRLLLGFLAILLSIEMSLYFSTSSSVRTTDKDYCSKTFLDYTFYKYASIGGCLVFMAITYIPDYRSYICSFECSIPADRSLYDQI